MHSASRPEITAGYYVSVRVREGTHSQQLFTGLQPCYIILCPQVACPQSSFVHKMTSLQLQQTPL